MSFLLFLKKVAPFGLSSCLPIREKNSFEELPFLIILAGYHMRAFVIFSKRGCKNALLAAYHLRSKIFLELVAFCRFKHGLYREQNFKEYPKKMPSDLHR